jgi:S1-C subfamily serine protease
MIRFVCPSCEQVLKVTDNHANQKVNCPKCGQRLLVPGPQPNRTILARPLAGPAAAPPEAPAAWSYRRGDKTHGPMAWEQLKALAASGQLKPDDLVWTRTMPQWAPARTVPGLMDAAAPRPKRGRGRGLLVGGLAAVALAALAIGGFVLAANRNAAPNPGGGSVVVVTPEPPKEPVKPGPVEEKPLTTVEIAERSKASVARVDTSSGGGTGFLVRPGVVVTNYHVVQGAVMEDVKVSFPSAGEKGKAAVGAQLLYEDRKRDLAVLRVATDLPPLKIAERYEWKAGEKIVVIGSPAANEITLENAVVEGLISTLVKMDGLPFYQINAAVNHGNSGGPLFDQHGQVVGVIARKAVRGRQEGMGFAIPLDDLKAALAKVDRQTAEAGEQAAAQHDLIVTSKLLAELCVANAAAMKVYGDRLQAARKAGTSLEAAFQQATFEINQALTQYFNQPVTLDALHEHHMKLIRGSIARIATDSRLPETHRAAFGKLVETHNAMRANLNNVGRPAFSERARELTNDLGAQIEALKTLLGLDEL